MESWYVYEGTLSAVAESPLRLTQNHFKSRSITYYPPKSWSIYIPVSALCIFLAAPILYASLNSSTVPRLDSMDILNDEHTRQSSSNRHAIPARSLPPE